ncbi:MAG: cellobiose phosphorylase, partial [Candidatus Omnitrophica bacterium]|nr:cellobiose phosphorylase [Candidatus Omnitrophota bacterium]
PTSFIPLYGRGEKNLRDHRHVSSLLNRVYLNKFGITLKPTLFFDEEGHSVNKAGYFVLGFQDDKQHPLGQFPTLDAFCGQGDLIFPQAIEDDFEPVNKNNKEFDGKENIAAFRFNNKKLKPNEEVNYFLIMGIDSELDEKNVKSIPPIFSKLDSPDKIEQSFQNTKEYWEEYLSNINIDFKNNDFNNWLLWVKIQPTLRKLFGCSFLPHFDYGKGGRGWRDLWQDSLTLLLTEPKKAKNLILNNFQGVRVDGSNATIITKEGDLISDRNKISRVWMDHGVWPYLTLRLYINKTGDLNILNQAVGYFSDHLFKRAKEINCKVLQKDNFLRTKETKIYKGTVLEHILIQNITVFFNVGQHNIIKLENADWNDGLDMAADKGESVAFSYMYAHNLKDLCFFLENLKIEFPTVCIMKELLILLDQIKSNTKVDYNNYKDKQKKLDEYLENTKQLTGDKVNVKIDDLIFDLEKKSKHLFEWLRKKEWLKQGFFN